MAITLGVGTQKGLFVFTSNDGKQFELAGQHVAGWEVSALLMRPMKNTIDYLVGTSHFAYGTVLRRSTDGGANWSQPEARPAHGKESPYKTNRIWQLSHHQPTNKLYAGIDEAALFESNDDGGSWSEVASLTSHPTRYAWQAGGGGLCLHTIVHDYSNPKRMWVGISAVGVFRTDDGGATWELKNKGLSYVPTGSVETETLFCVHKIVQHKAEPNKLFMQFHGGVYASEDAGDTWQRREVGLPGNFGFPIVGLADGTLLIAPLESDMTRYFKDGESTIYRSTDEAKTWQPAAAPTGGGPVFAGVLRDAMAGLGDRHAFFGTTSGQVATSADSGRTWQRLDVTLPRVLCVRAIES
jgi:photosystem II stability/assembly factor-like uncharacterized protein